MQARGARAERSARAYTDEGLTTVNYGACLHADETLAASVPRSAAVHDTRRSAARRGHAPSPRVPLPRGRRRARPAARCSPHHACRASHAAACAFGAAALGAVEGVAGATAATADPSTHTATMRRRCRRRRAAGDRRDCAGDDLYARADARGQPRPRPRRGGVRAAGGAMVAVLEWCCLLGVEPSLENAKLHLLDATHLLDAWALRLQYPIPHSRAFDVAAWYAGSPA